MRFYQPEKLLPLSGIEKLEQNWFRPNFKNGVYQLKKALNKSTRFEINQKSVSTSQNKDSLKNTIFLERKIAPSK